MAAVTYLLKIDYAEIGTRGGVSSTDGTDGFLVQGAGTVVSCTTQHALYGYAMLAKWVCELVLKTGQDFDRFY